MVVNSRRWRTAVFLGVRLLLDAGIGDRRFVFVHVDDFGGACKITVACMGEHRRGRASQKQGKENQTCCYPAAHDAQLAWGRLRNNNFVPEGHT